MSPRIAATARLVLFVLLAILIPQAMHAQSCVPPAIQVYEPEICPGTSYGGYASTTPPDGTTYTAYQWTIVNGTLPYGNDSYGVSFYATGEDDVQLQLTVTDQNGCPSTSSVTVPLRTLPPPIIDVYEPEICPNAAIGDYASVAPPPEGITYQAYEWSIVNGTLPYGNTSQGVSFTSNGAGPVELTVKVTENRGCDATATVTVPLRTIAAPLIDVYQPEICPNAAIGDYASVAPPPEGITYHEYEWSIVNGTLPYGNTSQGVSFTSNGAGPVQLSVKVTEGHGCQSTGTVTVPLRSIPSPLIEVYQPEICPNAGIGDYASVVPPPNGITYQTYEWSILNGALPYGNTSQGVSFTSNGAGPVQLSVKVTESYGCQSTGTVIVPLRSIPSPEIELYQPSICPGMMGDYATVAPPPPGITYQTYEWSIVNGALPYGNTGSGVSFTADGNGPVQLTVTVSESYGCLSSKTITVPLGSGTPPPITLQNPTFCSTESNHATLAGGFSSHAWSVANGTILSGQGTNQIEFTGDGLHAITVSVTANTAEGCPASNSVVVPMSAAPVEIYGPASACTGALQRAEATIIHAYSDFAWTATHASIEGPANDRVVAFRADGSGPVTLSVTALDGNGCRTANTYAIPLGSMPVPQIGVSDETICPIGGGTAYVSDLNTSYEWTVTNVSSFSGQGTPGIQFQHQPGAGDVEVTLRVGEGSCAATATRVIPVRQTVEPVLELVTPSICQNGSGTIYFDNYDSFSYVGLYATNGSLFVSGPGRVPGGRTLTFTSNGYGDVTLTIMPDSNACNQLRTYTVPMIPASLPTISVSGPTTFCEGGSVTLTASVGSSYLWSNGATTQSIVATQSGAYSVSVTNASGCTRTSSATSVTVQPLPNATISASGPTSFCAGGSVTLSVPTQGGATYLWSSGATTPSITVAAGGTFSVSVTSANGCSRASAPVAVTVNPNPVAGIQSFQIYDDGGSGTITRTGDAIEACGNPTVRLVSAALDPSFTYHWSTGATTALINVTTSGTYTLTVTTPSGCATTSSVSLHYGAIPPKPAIAAPATELCPAGGSVTLTAPDADGWTWSNGATTQSIVVTEPGSYQVRVRVGACDSALSDPVIVSTGLSTISTNDSLALCGPGSTATLTANDGTSWLWSNGATTRSITVSEAGTYRVTTTNNGCTMPESSPVTVTARSVSIDAGGPTSFCEGNSLTLTASNGTSWLWTTGATTQSITVSASGSYGVTASYGDGCSIVATPVAVDARHVTASVTADRDTVCTSGAIHLQATASGSAGYTYQWYDNTYASIAGATSSSLTLTPSASGFVYVKVHDELGCEVTSNSALYTVLPTPNATITTAAALCEGQTGSAGVADAGPGATYSWTITNGTLAFPNAPSVTFTPNGPGTVTLSVTIANAGCSVSSSKDVTINAMPAPAISASGPTTFCQGGSVTLTGQGGSGKWYQDGALLSAQPSITISALGSATYVYRIVTAAGCQADSAPVTVTVNPKVVISNTGGNTSACWNGVSDYEVANQPAGTTYFWTATNATIVSGQTNSRVYYQPVADATTVGLDVVVTNSSGCSTTGHYDFAVDRAAAVITANGPTQFCAGGSVTLSVPQAPAGWVPLWSNNATTQSITVSTSGTYTAHYVKLAGSCHGPESAPITVTVDALPTATITPSGPTTFCAGGSVTLTASASSSYLWSNGATTQSINVNASGSFHVTVTNANGCSKTSPAMTVNVNALPTATITPSGPTTFCAGGSVTLTAGAASSYLWSNGATTQSINVTTSGNYSVTVTNASSCSATSSPATVTVTALPTATITPSGPTTFCAGGSVTLTASAGASYLWSNGATTQSINATTSGSYSVTVTNASGCSATSSPTTVTANALPTPSISTSGPTTFCEGGSVTLTASAGASYLWSNGATTRSINATTSGNYSVTVTSAAGCSGTSSPAAVTVNPLPTPTITPSGPTTFCAGGSVTLTASAGASYLWSNGATTQSIVVNATGSFNVTVTNANGCSAMASPVAVTANALPSANIYPSGPTTFCAGGSVLLTASAGASYLWSNGATTQSINATASGNYTVTITSASGCSTTSSPTTVTVNASPAATITPSGPTTFCAGGSVTLTASAGASYAWSSGATTQSINVTASGTYNVTVTNANGCSATSAPQSVTVNAKPSTPVITASGPTTFCAGGSVTLTAPAGFTYLWSNGATTQAINATASGSYSVTVTNASGCSTASAPTTVTVTPATTITQQPQSASIPRNTTTQLSVTATGTGTLTYQWYKGTSPSTATPISGATSSTYTTPKLAKGTYTYWVRVTGTCGLANSTTATITVP